MKNISTYNNFKIMMIVCFQMLLLSLCVSGVKMKEKDEAPRWELIVIKKYQTCNCSSENKYGFNIGFTMSSRES